MRIAYCTNVRLPSERAHGIQVARVCDALAKLGHAVEIIAPRRSNPVQEDFWTYHNVDRRVRLTIVPSFDGIDCPLTPGILGLKLTTWSYVHKALFALKESEFDLLYTRTPEILPALLTTGMPVIAELHKLPRFRRQRFTKTLKRCRLVVCLTTPMQEELVRWGVPRE